MTIRNLEIEVAIFSRWQSYIILPVGKLMLSSVDSNCKYYDYSEVDIFRIEDYRQNRR